MTLDQIRKYIYYICVKENSGNTLTPDNINIIFTAASIDMYNKKVEKAQIFSIQNKVSLTEALGNIIELRDFLTTQDLTIVTPGSYTLVSLDFEFGYWSSMVAIYNGATRKVDLVSDSEWGIRLSNQLALPIEEYPMAKLLSSQIYILPTDVTTPRLTYYRKPISPVYDYYLDTNVNEIYLAAGTNYTLLPGEIGSAGQTSGTVTSNTVELDWIEIHHIEFCNEVLQRVGINLKDQQIAQYINQAKQEQS
jgi:hypothetical protein